MWQQHRKKAVLAGMAAVLIGGAGYLVFRPHTERSMTVNGQLEALLSSSRPQATAAEGSANEASEGPAASSTPAPTINSRPASSSKPPTSSKQASNSKPQPSSKPQPGGKPAGQAAATPAPAPSAAHTDSKAEVKLDMNTAGVEDWMTLPGIGEAKAKAIVAYRDAHGGFKRKEELKEVKGIGEQRYGQIASMLQLAGSE